MQKSLILWLVVVFIFTGCAASRVSSEASFQIAAKPALGSTTYFHKANIWPLKNKGIYLQKITATVKGKQHSFSIHLTLDDYMLEAIAFNDMVGRLYSLKWTPQGVEWEGSAYIPKFIMPENIIADFLMVHLPAKQLEGILQGAQVFEQAEGSGKIRYVRGREVRTITYENPLGAMWGHVVIHNLVLGYKLDIQTVRQ